LLSESQAEMDGVLRRSGLPDGKFWNQKFG
jgi:hypothetical protein